MPKMSLLGYLFCGAVLALLVAALALAAEEGTPQAGALVTLLLVGSTIPLVSAVWSGAFHHR